VLWAFDFQKEFLCNAPHHATWAGKNHNS